MIDLKEIKEKMQEFFDEFKNINTPDEAIRKFKEIFKDEYFETFSDVDEPYYECHTQKIYLKNGYGVGIKKSWGPFDFAGGGLISHEGEDVYIFSKIANKYIPLFEWSEKQEIPNEIDSLYDIDLSTKNLLSVNDDLIFNFIPENELENTDEMLIGRYKNLKRKAELDHENDVSNDLISYYGGLDITIHSTEYYLYNSLLENKYNEEFMNKVMPLFNQDFPSYFNDEIEECNQALYIIENKDKYYKLIEYEERGFKLVGTELHYIDDIKLTENKQVELQTKLDDELNKLNEIKNKKYSVIDFFRGTKKKDLIRASNIQQNVFLLETKLDTKKKELEVEKSNYGQLQSEREMDEETKKQLKEELKYPFKDFTLIPDFEEEPYIKGEYYLKVSLDRLIDRKEFYTQKLQELEFMKNYANNKDLAIENEKEEVYEKAI
ncbi:MAG: hypothetical protein HFJ29_03320 [Clostridia bacterium]|nr:hypothetical protein [Clostridia bacterium]